MTYIKVKDKNYLERDVFSNGIVNTDIENYRKYVEGYRQTYNQKQKIKKLEVDMEDIKQNLLDIKSLILTLVNHEP